MIRTTRALALAGVLTGVSGLVTAQATVWILRARNGPVDAVAAAVRDYTPGGLAHQLIKVVQHADKPLLLVGTTVLLLAVCAWTGVQARRRPLLPDVVYFVLAAIGLLAVLRLRDSSSGSTFAIVVGLITWIVVHRLLTGPLVSAGAELDGPTRRSFLTRIAWGTAAVGGTFVVGWFSDTGKRAAEQSRDLVRLDKVTRGVVPPGANLGVDGIAPWRTSNRSFYRIDTAFRVPYLKAGDWSLRIHGMVDRELTLSYSDLVNRQFTEDWITLCCVSNEVGGDLISNAFWSGVKISELLAEAGVHDDADAVLQTSDDGWTCGTPLTALTDERNAMLALAMNGEKLPFEHGFPVRMVVPGLFGYVSATKWLVDLEVTRFDKVNAYWTERGWSEKGPVVTESRIDVPRDGARTKTGLVKVGGSAWAQHTGIAKVEYQLDGGSWQEATLGAIPDLDTWVQWSGEVDLPEGKHTLVVRATDRSGYTQTSVRTDVVPSGATGWHTVVFRSG
jgi:DMSO/TMAO reductase YedYZ molybdopterin-dependent catalytic subunit